MRPVHRLILLLVCTLGLAACNKEKDYIVPDSSFGLIYTRIFEQSCALSACHGYEKAKDAELAEYPAMKGEDIYERLFNGAVQNTSAQSAGLKLITPGDPDNSFLYQKIIYDSSSFQFGAKMPSGGLSLSADQIAFVREWIEAGAPETGHVADRSLIE